MYLRRWFHDKSRTASLWPSSECLDFYLKTNMHSQIKATWLNLCFDIKSIPCNVELVNMFVFANEKLLLAGMSTAQWCKMGIWKSCYFKICFTIWPLTFFDFFLFLLPSETTGSSVSTKSKSQISTCGSIVPTATKLAMGKKW